MENAPTAGRSPRRKPTRRKPKLLVKAVFSLPRADGMQLTHRELDIIDEDLAAAADQIDVARRWVARRRAAIAAPPPKA